MVPLFSPPSVSRGRFGKVATALALSLALAGCASVPPPDDSMNLAQTQLQAARDAGAADYAPVDLGFAQDKFQQAQNAMAERKYAQAADLSEESRADAELAQAKALLGAARAKIQDKVHENTRLRALGEQEAADAARQQEQQPAAPADASSSSLPDEELPAPAATSPEPAPSSSSAPAGAAGFQTLPDNSQPAAAGQPSDTDGGQP